MLAYYAEKLADGRDQQHVLPNAGARDGAQVGGRDAHNVPLRAQEPTPDHTREAAASTRARRSAGCSRRPASSATSWGRCCFSCRPTRRRTSRCSTRSSASCPRARAPALEFRHESWFAPDVYDVLRKRGAALCIAEAEDLATPLEATAPWGYLRLRRQDYDDAAVAAWAQRFARRAGTRPTSSSSTRTRARGPKLAAQLIAALDTTPRGSQTPARPGACAAEQSGPRIEFFVHGDHSRVQSPTWRAQLQAERSRLGWSRSR